MKYKFKRFATFEEAYEENLRQIIAKTPAERIASAVKIIKKVYKYKPGMPANRRITFIGKPDWYKG